MEQVRFLHVYEDVFHAGKNFGKKLTTKNVEGLEIIYDKMEVEEKRFKLTYQGRTGYLGRTNIAFWEPESSQPIITPKNEHKTEHVEGRKRAQVSTPMDHVFEGRGHGKVRQ